MCRRTCETMVQPQASSLSICAQKLPMSSTSVWTNGQEAHSCQGRFTPEGASMCADDNGNPDLTSISLDLNTVSDPVGCFLWETRDCKFDMNKIATVELDAEWSGCGELWFAPFWHVSLPWIAPQGTSGEIDYIETCRLSGYKVQTAIICRDHPHEECEEPYWADGASSDGPVHLSASIDANGTWRMSKCDIDGTNCLRISQYPDYLDVNSATKDGGTGSDFHFVSDIWNGIGGDVGWQHCGNTNREATCRYAVRNVKVTTKDGSNPFSNSKCNAMFAGRDGGDGITTPSPTAASTTQKLRVCDSWCAGHQSQWSTKCLWAQCADCPACSSEDGGFCEFWCEGLSEGVPGGSWSRTCQFSSCQACAQCQQLAGPKPALCEDWCANHDDPCSWDYCEGCTQCATTATPMPTPAMTPLPTSRAPSMVSENQFSSDPCESVSQDTQLVSAQGFSFQGVAIRTDACLTECRDCAARCWRQMSDCVGFAWEKASCQGDEGACTYFSRIDSVVSKPGMKAYTTASTITS